MRSFKEVLDSMDNAVLGAKVRDRYERLMEAHSMGLTETHPAAQWNADNAVLRAHRVAKDAAGSGLGARELEENDGAQDDPPQPPARPGAALAAHDSLEELRIRQRGGANVEGELHLARIRRADPAAARAMNAAIPGLDRLR
jgi:hypothetical protein